MHGQTSKAEHHGALLACVCAVRARVHVCAVGKLVCVRDFYHCKENDCGVDPARAVLCLPSMRRWLSRVTSSLLVACTFMAQDADATTACSPAVLTLVGVL